MEFNLSDFPICNEMFDDVVEAGRPEGALTGDDRIVTGDSIPPSHSDDPNRYVLNLNSPYQINACKKSFVTRVDLLKHIEESHVLVQFTNPPGGCDNNDDLQSSATSSGTNEHEIHVAPDKADKERSEEHSNGRLSVHWKDDPAACQTVANLLISEKIKNRRPTPYWPDHLQSMRAAREANELERHAIVLWRIIAFLAAAGIVILVSKLLQKLSISFAFCRCTVAASSQSAASHAPQRILLPALPEHEGSLSYAIRGIGGDHLLRQFLETVRSIPPYTPATTQEARWVIAAAAVIFVFTVWKLGFLRDTPWRSTPLYIPVQWWARRRGAFPRRPRRLNRTVNDNDHGRPGAGSVPDDHVD